MWRYKIDLVNKELENKITEELSNLRVLAYSDKPYIVVECSDHYWDKIMAILSTVNGYSLVREYYD